MMKRTALIVAMAAAGLAGFTQGALADQPTSHGAHEYLVQAGLIDNPVQTTNVREAVRGEPQSEVRATLVDAGLAEPPVKRYEPLHAVVGTKHGRLNPVARYLPADTGMKVYSRTAAPKG